ncbi:MAG: PAS domain S-box protein [Candidatus Latescibacteria bacterium]|nr:PAS domain S-box protein [Candidatus Latescibacterota bacterium]
MKDTSSNVQNSGKSNLFFFEEASVGMFETDAHGRFISVNCSGSILTGYSKEELLGMAITDISDSEDREFYMTNLHELRVGEIVRKPCNILKKDNTLLSVEISILMQQGGNILFIIYDFSARKQSGFTGRDTYYDFLNVIEYLPDATFVIDRNKRIIAWNRACEFMTGIKKEDMMGQSDFAYAEPFFGERRHILIDLLDISSVEIESQYSYIKRAENSIYAESFTPWLWNGQGAHIWEMAAPLHDDKGKRCGAIEVIRDVSEQKHIEQALHQSEVQFQLIMENLTDMVAVLDLEGNRMYNSPSYQNLLGDPDQLKGSSSFDQVHPEDRERVQEVFRETVRSGMGKRMEYRLVNRDGQTRYIESQGNVIRDTHGNVSQVVVVSRDVTERKQTEEQLETSERKYRELVEYANSIILRWTSDGNITFMNEFGLRFFDYTAEELLGQPVVGTIVPPIESDGRDLRHLMKDIFANIKEYEENVNENMRRNGERVWVSWNNRIVAGTEGHVTEVLSVGTDITERKRAEEQIRKLHEDLQRHAAELECRVEERTAELAIALDHAEESDRLKSAFLATMSHELRTPLNSIIGFTGILLMGLVGPLSDEQEKQLRMVQDSAQHLLDLINDVLDISKIEAGQIDLAREPFDMRMTICKSLEKVTPLAEKKGLAVSAEVISQDCRIVGDRRRLEQILINLLSNAVKFTDRGEVRIECKIEGAWLVTRVIDTGIGIRTEDIDSLFKPFRQVDTGITRRYEGTGLGLSICKRLVELMGGDIKVESEWGKGSCFIFTLPLERTTS